MAISNIASLCAMQPLIPVPEISLCAGTEECVQKVLKAAIPKDHV